MFHTAFDFSHDMKKNIHQNFKHLLYDHSSLAVCLIQLRQLKIQFLNLGNIIICPEQHCYLVFQAKQLNRIELLHAECSAVPN